MDRPSGLVGLPRELRDQIYDELAKDEDLSSFMHTCREFREAALCRMPGAAVIDYAHATDKKVQQRIKRKLDITCVNLVAEPWYSSGSCLRIEVEWRVRKRGGKQGTSCWTIRDLSSPMVRYIYWYQPDYTQITFEPATSGYFLGALMILRAKVFDICQILSKMEPKEHIGKFIHVHFCGAKDLECPDRLRKSFWEMRPGAHLNFSTRRAIRKARYGGEVLKRRQHQAREDFLYFYEYLMLPLFSCKPWVPSCLEFDYQPAKNRSSFIGYTGRPDSTDRVYYGAQELFDRTELEFVTTEDESYHDDRWWDGIYNVLNLLDSFSEEAPDFLEGIVCRETKELRAYLLRMRQALSHSPFASSSDPDTRLLKMCTCTHCTRNWPFRDTNTSLRSAYINWAEDGGKKVTWKSKSGRAEGGGLDEILDTFDLATLFDGSEE
jgi:hypothetical protein